MKEESVRQSLLYHMVNVLGYPQGLIVVERGIADILKICNTGCVRQIPSRRIDLLCFFKDKKNFFPLLLVECKLSLSTVQHWNAAFRQVLGYNAFVQAPFCAVASSECIYMCHPQKKRGLPSYRELLEGLYVPER